MIETERLILSPFDMKHLEDYYNGFNEKITKYQWPDPFEKIDNARDMLQTFVDEMKQGETLLYSILSKDEAFLGSVEMHGLSEDCPEIGIWISGPEQKKGYAYEALCALLDYAFLNHHKTEYYYEVDIRNVGSLELLRKLEKQYEVTKQGLEETMTDSGTDLKLQSYILKKRV